MSSTIGLNQDVAELEDALKELRIAYEKYFAGVERVEPSKQRDAIRKQLLRLVGESTKNTARRFRLQTLQASFVTYEQHWNRITRQIEEGTFKRDKLRAERRQAGAPRPAGLYEELPQLEPEPPGSAEPSGPEELEPEPTLESFDEVELSAEPAAPARTPATAGTRPASAAPAGGGGSRPAHGTGDATHAGAAARPGPSRAAPTARAPSTLDDLDEVLALANQLTSAKKPTAAPSRPSAPAPSPRGRPGSEGTAGSAAPPASTRPATAPPPAAPASRPAGAPAASRPSSPTPGGFSTELRELHQSYVKTRESQGERDPVTIDSFAVTLQKQAAAIKERFKCRDVEFKVAVKDGKTILKATPKG